MCKYSLEGYKSRRALQGETLVANMHEARGHGCLTQPGESRTGTLTCVIDGTKLTIEKVELIPNLSEGSILGYGLHLGMLEYVGKRVVVRLIDGRHVRSGHDTLRVEDGKRNIDIPLIWLKRGTEVYVGVKKTLDEKLGLEAKALAKAALDMSDPKDKPDNDEEKKEGEKEPEGDKPKEVAVRVHRTVTAPTPPSRRILERFRW